MWRLRKTAAECQHIFDQPAEIMEVIMITEAAYYLVKITIF